MVDEALSMALKQFGLTDKEMNVYLANLQLGSARVTRIAAKSGVLRETTYAVLNGLMEQGLASCVVKGGVNYYAAATPEKFLNILREKEEKISSVLPSLQAMKALTSEKPTVKLYEGVAGLKTIMDDFITTGKPMLALGSTRALHDKLLYYFPNYIQRRKDAGIPIKVLTEETSLTKKMRSNDNAVLREMRYYPAKYALPNTFFIYGQKIAFLDVEKNMVGVVIQNSEIVRSFESIFQMLWDISDS